MSNKVVSAFFAHATRHGAIAELFDTARSNIVEHIKHIYKEDELSVEATCRKFRQVRMEGNND
jgi:hypothetical protein